MLKNCIENVHFFRGHFLQYGTFSNGTFSDWDDYNSERTFSDGTFLVIGMITIVKGHLFSDGTFSDGMITILKGHLVMGRLEMG